MAVAVLLKERNKHMIGVQSAISLLLFVARVDKQISSMVIVVHMYHDIIY